MLFQPSIKIGRRRVSAADPCYIIAEIGVNHNGDVSLAHRLIDEAFKAGADAVKFQAFHAAELALVGAPKANYQKQSTGAGNQLEMLQGLELPVQAFVELRDHCHQIGIDFICTAFDSASLDEVLDLHPTCLKWPSGDINNFPLLRQATASGVPMIVSTGMATIGEVSAALDQIAEGRTKDVVLLQCVSNYPAKIEDQNLRAMVAMSSAFGVPVGFSDHTTTEHAAIAAKALGMSVLEKHFTLDRTMEGPDHEASMEPADFGALVKVLRSIEIGLGDGVKKPVASEMNTRSVARKSLVFTRDLPAGHVISRQDLTAKRPAGGVSPDLIDLFVGQTLLGAVERDYQLDSSCVSGKV